MFEINCEYPWHHPELIGKCVVRMLICAYLDFRVSHFALLPDIYSSKYLFAPRFNNNENDLISYYYTVKWTHFANYTVEFKWMNEQTNVWTQESETPKCLSFSVRVNIWPRHDRISAKRQHTEHTKTNKWNKNSSRFRRKIWVFMRRGRRNTQWMTVRSHLACI